jgi:hypothetical protein
MDAISLTVTAASLLFGFLFAGFWWALDRELKFDKKERHFQYAYALLLGTMAIVAVFGIIRPLSTLAAKEAGVSAAFNAIVIAFIGVFGYMLTEFGHYSVFQRPKYETSSECVFFWVTVAAMAGVFLWGLR